MPRIELNDMLKLPGITLEQALFIAWFYSQFDTGAPGRRVINVQPLFYQGLVAGTEFLVYAATKLYLTLEFIGGYSNAISPSLISFYDAANNACLYLCNNIITFDSVMISMFYFHNSFNEKNVYFSRLTATNINSIKFNGYRITLI